ncbi:MAG TPA: hypothetical protein VFD13_02685 [Candidatus Kapabacteria bacterium]|nr:hypothetical protein [Candidatus Kapabacteria bacterium]
MKPLIAALFLLALASTSSYAQFRSDASQPQPPLNTAGAMSGGGDSFLSGLLDPARFSMHQSVSMSFVSSGFGSTGLSMFTNTFAYRPSSDLYISADVSMVYSPFSTFGSAFQNQMNGVYLTNAQIDWKLSDNTFLRVEYMGGPGAGMYGGYSPYSYNPFYSASPFAAPGAHAASANVQLH